MCRLLLIAWLLVSALVVQAQPQPIKILLNNWTSQIVLSYVAAEVFKQQGYAVEFVASPVSEQWGGLSHGLAHVQVEVWQGTMSQDFDRLVALGTIEDLGAHEATTREDWWYPNYVEKLCPGLPQWQALKDCAQVFSKDGKSAGIYVAGPWEKPDEARIRALGLNFKVKPVKNGDELWVALKQAVRSQTPIVLFNWSPNWVESRYEGKFVEFPVYHPDCETNPAWGENPNFLYDCGNPAGGWLKKAAWSGFQAQFPCAYESLKNMNFSNAQIASAAALVDVEQQTYQQAASSWMATHQSIWKPWLNTSCQHD